MENTISDKLVTYDFARLMDENVKEVSCSGFGNAIIERL
jgi:isocitrate dehydrogenase